MSDPTPQAGAVTVPGTIDPTTPESAIRPASESTATGGSITGLNPQILTVCIVLATAGVFTCLAGLVILAQRQPIAALLLNARILFDVPWSQVDAQKVAFVTAHGLAALVGGAMLLVDAITISILRLRRGAQNGPSSCRPTTDRT